MFELYKGDITELKVDAIVNAANRTLWAVVKREKRKRREGIFFPQNTLYIPWDRCGAAADTAKRSC